MAQNRDRPKRAVNMSLNADLVRRAKNLTDNLSDTVELLLEAFVQTEEARQADIKGQLAQWAVASNALVARYGSPADEHDQF